MAELEKAITTQEELDAVIKDRIARAKESAEKKFDGWISPEAFEDAKKELEKQISDLQQAAAESEKKLAEKDAKLAEAETYRTDLAKTRIALQAGLDPKYASRLQGSNEEEWTKDAKEMAKDFAAKHTAVPLGNGEKKPGGEVNVSAKFADWFNTNYN